VGRREWAAQFSDTQQVQWVRLPVTCYRARFTKYAKDKKIKDERREKRARSGTDISLRRLTGKLQSVIRLRVPAYSSDLPEKLSLWTPKRHMGEWNGSVHPIILNLGTRWRAVVRFTLRVALHPE